MLTGYGSCQRQEWRTLVRIIEERFYLHLWSKDKFITGFALNPSLQFPGFAPQDQQVIINDNTAVLNALVHIKFISRAGAAPEELCERTTETYVRQQGVWKLLALQATFLPGK